MTSLHPLLLFTKFSARDELLPFARTQGEKWRNEFRRRIKKNRYRLTEQRELFKRDGICALFNAENLRVVYFPERLSEVFSLWNEDCDLTDVQRIHDAMSAPILRLPDGEDAVQLPHFWMLLLELVENGFLTEDQQVPTAPTQPHAQDNSFTGLMILPSFGCNFRCDYCYHRDIIPTVQSATVLSTDMAKRGVDYFLANSLAPPEVSRSIRFAGGEPTLHYQLVRDVLEYAAETRLRDPRLAPFALSMITNGSLLDEKWIELIKKHGIEIAVSIDGRQERHDVRRKSLQGSAYSRTTRGIKRLGDAGIKPTILVTVSSHNIDAVSEDVAWLFDNFQIAAFALNVDASNTSKYTVPPAQYAQSIVKAFDELSYRGLFDSRVVRINGRFQSKKITVGGCGAIFVNMVLFPDGRIGACPRKSDQSERMEIVEGQDPHSSEIFRRWSSFNYSLNKTCQKCNYRNICEGWCPDASLKFNGQPSEPNEYTCQYMKRLLEWLIWYDLEQILGEQK